MAEKTLPAKERSGEKLGNIRNDDAHIAVPGSDYVESTDLTAKPLPLASAEIPFPDDVTRAESGVVRIAVFIGDTGSVDNVVIDESNLPDVYRQAAASAFRKFRFSPGRMNGKPVRSKMQFEVRFDTNQGLGFR